MTHISGRRNLLPGALAQACGFPYRARYGGRHLQKWNIDTNPFAAHARASLVRRLLSGRPEGSLVGGTTATGESAIILPRRWVPRTVPDLRGREGQQAGRAGRRGDSASSRRPKWHADAIRRVSSDALEMQWKGDGRVGGDDAIPETCRPIPTWEWRAVRTLWASCIVSQLPRSNAGDWTEFEVSVYRYVHRSHAPAPRKRERRSMRAGRGPGGPAEARWRTCLCADRCVTKWRMPPVARDSGRSSTVWYGSKTVMRAQGRAAGSARHSAGWRAQGQ